MPAAVHEDAQPLRPRLRPAVPPGLRELRPHHRQRAAALRPLCRRHPLLQVPAGTLMQCTSFCIRLVEIFSPPYISLFTGSGVMLCSHMHNHCSAKIRDSRVIVARMYQGRQGMAQMASDIKMLQIWPCRAQRPAAIKCQEKVQVTVEGCRQRIHVLCSQAEQTKVGAKSAKASWARNHPGLATCQLRTAYAFLVNNIYDLRTPSLNVVRFLFHHRITPAFAQPPAEHC